MAFSFFFLTIETRQSRANLHSCFFHSTPIASVQAMLWQISSKARRKSRQSVSVGCVDSGGPAALATEASTTRHRFVTDFFLLIWRTGVFQRRRDIPSGFAVRLRRNPPASRQSV